MDGSVFGIKDFLIAIKNKWYLILGLTLIGLCMSSFYAIKICQPVYQGLATVIVGNGDIKANKPQRSPVDSESYGKYVKTYMVYIRTTDFMKAAMNYGGLNYDSRAVLGSLGVESSESATTIKFSYSGSDKEMINEILSSVTNYFVENSSKYVSGPNVSILEDVYIPDTQIWPNTKKIITLGTMLGLMLGMGISIIIELCNNRLKNEEEAQRIVKAPVIGTIPKGTKISSALAIKDDPSSSVAEGYRTLRTNIEYSSFDDDMNILLVCSSHSNEGKTTIASNLALSFANTDKKTLLVDCDLRNPNVHKTFNISNKGAISEVIIGKKSLQSVVREVSNNLFVLTAGSKTPNPSEMLGSKSMENLLEIFKGTYDLVILDSPPVQAVSDSQILANKSDGVIFVIKANSTKKSAVSSSKKLFEMVNARIIGTVLNYKDREHKEDLKYYSSSNSHKWRGRKNKKGKHKYRSEEDSSVNA